MLFCLFSIQFWQVNIAVLEFTSLKYRRSKSCRFLLNRIRSIHWAELVAKWGQERWRKQTKGAVRSMREMSQKKHVFFSGSSKRNFKVCPLFRIDKLHMDSPGYQRLESYEANSMLNSWICFILSVYVFNPSLALPFRPKIPSPQADVAARKSRYTIRIERFLRVEWWENVSEGSMFTLDLPPWPVSQMLNGAGRFTYIWVVLGVNIGK